MFDCKLLFGYIFHCWCLTFPVSSLVIGSIQFSTPSFLANCIIRGAFSFYSIFPCGFVSLLILNIIYFGYPLLFFNQTCKGIIYLTGPSPQIDVFTCLFSVFYFFYFINLHLSLLIPISCIFIFYFFNVYLIPSLL